MMQMELILPFVTAAAGILAAGMVVLRTRIRKEGKASTRDGLVRKLLSSVISCNEYPKILDMYGWLNDGLKEHGIEINDSFKDYFSDE